MRILQHLMTTAALALALRWLWQAASSEKAKVESGRQVFPATKAVRFLLILFAILFAALTAASVLLLLNKPESWWVPYLFLGFLLLVLLSYPPVLTIDVDGVVSQTWFGKEKKVRWEDISSLHYNPANRNFTVRARNGKITHAGFNADANLFREEIQRRTRLPVKIAQPGLWKTETVEVPYEEVESPEDDA